MTENEFTGQETILIVEDEPANMELFETYLSKMGYVVCPYNLGGKAYEGINSGLSYDLAIFDLSLPYIDGFELLKISKSLHPEIPVFTMSAYAFQHELVQRHFQKPFRLEDLLREIKKFL